MFNTFSIARLPRIEFGAGTFSKVGAICRQYGKNVLLVTGARSFRSSAAYAQLMTEFIDNTVTWEHCVINGEPSPQMIDEAVKQFSPQAFDVVLGIGGGSALDAAKAIAGLLLVKRSVIDYLEGVGPELVYEGPAVPFIAVPTTAGTGSEATKNAVLSLQGKDGYKKSFRDDKLVAEYAIVDPDLLSTCPRDVIAANGMDALTQLMESYVSTNANPMTDALALSGLHAIRDGLFPFMKSRMTVRHRKRWPTPPALGHLPGADRTRFGAWPGFPLGAFYPIPHGVVCGTLVAKATQINITALLEREPDNPALGKYAHLGNVLSGRQHNTPTDAREQLCRLLSDWCEKLRLQRLSQYGLTEEGLDHVVAHSRGSSMKTNPIVLTDDELKSLLLARL